MVLSSRSLSPLDTKVRARKKNPTLVPPAALTQKPPVYRCSHAPIRSPGLHSSLLHFCSPSQSPSTSTASSEREKERKKISKGLHHHGPLRARRIHTHTHTQRLTPISLTSTPFFHLLPSHPLPPPPSLPASHFLPVPDRSPQRERIRRNPAPSTPLLTLSKTSSERDQLDPHPTKASHRRTHKHSHAPTCPCIFSCGSVVSPLSLGLRFGLDSTRLDSIPLDYATIFCRVACFFLLPHRHTTEIKEPRGRS